MMKLAESLQGELEISPDTALTEPIDRASASAESSRRRLSAPSRRLCGVSDIGKCRSNNEDKYFLSPDGNLWIVADGMGGHAAGEVASALTIEAIVAFLDSPAGSADAGVSTGNRLVRAFGAAQNWVSARSYQDAECRGMGSTAIAGLLDGEELNICHVGDVRAYHWSANQFKRITNDHSVVWDFVLSGLLTPEEARVHPQRSKVTQAIGTLPGVKPDLAKLMLKPGDRLLLCSDGLWEELADHDMCKVVSSDCSMQEMATLLVDKANTAGGRDNISAVLYEHAAPAS
jgi:protein phosphatase